MSVLGDTQDPAVGGPEQLAPGDPALSRGWTRQFPEVPRSLNHSLILFADPHILRSSPTTLTRVFPQPSGWHGVCRSWAKAQISSSAADSQRHLSG